jgi:hypothetical protein
MKKIKTLNKKKSTLFFYFFSKQWRFFLFSSLLFYFLHCFFSIVDSSRFKKQNFMSDKKTTFFHPRAPTRTRDKTAVFSTRNLKELLQSHTLGLSFQQFGVLCL